MRTLTAHPASDHIHRLAEGPVWDADRGRVLWVDIEEGHVFEGAFVDGTVAPLRRHDFPSTVGAVVSSPAGTLLVAGRDGLIEISVDGRRTGAKTLLPPGVRSRLNDGACDPAGRFLVGSMALDCRRGQERLYRLETDGDVIEVDEDLTLSNGLAWSPDGGRFYSIDTTPGVVWARPYEPASGRFGDRTVLLDIDGSPDGMCVDQDGNLWIAIWGAGEVRCYSPGGSHQAVVHVAAPHTSSVAFIGEGLDTLLITTAVQDLSPAQLAEFPDSGRLFTADVGIRGLPTTPWAGPSLPEQVNP